MNSSDTIPKAPSPNNRAGKIYITAIFSFCLFFSLGKFTSLANVTPATVPSLEDFKLKRI